MAPTWITSSPRRNPMRVGAYLVVEERNPTAWKVAEKEWRGVVAVENLQTLESFRRIAP